VLQAMAKGGSKVSLEDLEAVVFAPWHAEYNRREEMGKEASWSLHLQRLRNRFGGGLGDLELLELWFRPYGEHLLPTEGAQEALEELGEMDLKLALVSNVPLPGQLYGDVLERHGLKAPFDCLLFSYDEGSRKPSPALLRLAMSKLGSDPAATIMVGDRRERDIAAGRFAGTRTVWIRRSDSGGSEADATIDSVNQLPDLLRRWQR